MGTHEYTGFDVGAAVRQLIGGSLGYLYPAALRAAVVHSVPDHLDDGPLTAEALAGRTGTESGRLRRLLRFLVTHGLLTEDDGAFGLTPTGALLRTGAVPSVRDVVLLFTDELYWAPAGRLADSVADGHTAFDGIFGAPFFDRLAADERGTAVFGAGIATLSGFEQAAVAASYEFPDGARVADLGGGHGGMLGTVLARYPTTTGVVVDRAGVEPSALHRDGSLDGRWSTAVCDIRAEVPPGMDVYLLKRILHDKDDAECGPILRACRKAMRQDSVLLVLDAVVSRAGGDTPADQLSDLLMMTVWNGRERTRAEFEDLLAESGLRISRVLPTPTSLSVVEAVPR